MALTLKIYFTDTWYCHRRRQIEVEMDDIVGDRQVYTHYVYIAIDNLTLTQARSQGGRGGAEPRLEKFEPPLAGLGCPP